jgi:hypothetical protein
MVLSVLSRSALPALVLHYVQKDLKASLGIIRAYWVIDPVNVLRKAQERIYPITDIAALR